MKNNNIRYRHLHDDNGRLVGTVATRRLNQHAVEASVAVVREGEQGKKVLGADLAIGRLVLGETRTFKNDDFMAALKTGELIRSFGINRTHRGF